MQNNTEEQKEQLRLISLRNLNPKHYIPERFHHDIPVFAGLILRDHTIEDDEKFSFVNNFLIRYLTDQDFRNRMQGLWILFLKKKFVRIQSVHEPDESVEGYENSFIEITDDYQYGYIMPLVQTSFSVMNNFSGMKKPKINLKLHFGSDIHSERRLVDTGSQFTTLFYNQCWDYNSGMRYNSSEIGNGRYQFNPSDLNSNIKDVDPLSVKCAGGISDYKIVTWKIPLKVSIDNLPPIDVNSMVVPVNFVEDLNIMGTDIIYRHTMLMTSLNKEVNFTFLQSEQYGELILADTPIAKKEGFLHSIGFNIEEQPKQVKKEGYFIDLSDIINF